MVEANPEQDNDQRLMNLFAPLIADKAAWEASFTEEEKAKGAEFEATLRTDPEAAMAFQQEINDTFAACDANNDGLLDRAEFAAFVTASNQNGVNRGLKNRETTEEFMDMVYPAFNGFNEATDGVSKGEILTILQYLNAHMD